MGTMERSQSRMRHTKVMHRRLVAAVGVVVLTAACTSSPPATDASASSPGSPAVVSPTTASSTGMRGVRVTDLPCPWQQEATPSPSASPRTMPGGEMMPWQKGSNRPVTGDVTEFWICQWQNSPMGLGDPAIVTASNPSAFMALDHALRLPNQPPAKGICTAMGWIYPVVVVRTSDGDWVAQLPYDECGRALLAVRRAIA